jgi:hypothetical protein
MEATWNTGRKYTSAGQIIHARVQPTARSCSPISCVASTA